MNISTRAFGWGLGLSGDDYGCALVDVEGGVVDECIGYFILETNYSKPEGTTIRFRDKNTAFRLSAHKALEDDVSLNLFKRMCEYAMGDSKDLILDVIQALSKEVEFETMYINEQDSSD